MLYVVAYLPAIAAVLAVTHLATFVFVVAKEHVTRERVPVWRPLPLRRG